MRTESPVIRIDHLVRRYGRTDAVNGLSLQVEPGRCYGFFGRNGAGKTTTIKCLLNLLRPTAGAVRLFGLDPARQEVAVKSRLAYVPDYVAFYPWMTVRETLDYLASFRARWNGDKERDLVARFQLEPSQLTSHLSKGQKTQLALIAAICPEPDLLVLDEPTSGLDPIVRREFIETVIGAFQEGDPGRRTVFVSTHLISEFEGLIDEFTILDRGREVMTLESDLARERYRKIHVRFRQETPAFELAEVAVLRREPREVELVANGNSERVLEELRALRPESIHTESLTLEEIFVTAMQTGKLTASAGDVGETPSPGAANEKGKTHESRP
jgi:ABC-2 type transport system ATP-binding protein